MAANYETSSIGCDVTFELNEFNNPRIKSEIETLKDIILFILFSRPGQYPSLPQIGLNIRDYLYDFYDEINALCLGIISRMELSISRKLCIRNNHP